MKYGKLVDKWKASGEAFEGTIKRYKLRKGGYLLVGIEEDGYAEACYTPKKHKRVDCEYVLDNATGGGSCTYQSAAEATEAAFKPRPAEASPVSNGQELMDYINAQRGAGNV